MADLKSRDFESAVIAQITANEDSILQATVDGETLCPNCKGKGHEGLGLLESDWPCRRCYGRGLLGSGSVRRG